MDKLIFVVVLFIMGLACLGNAAVNGSLGWLAGAIAFFVVGVYAKRLLVREVTEPDEEPDEGASMGFVLKACAVMLVAMAALAWFFSR